MPGRGPAPKPADQRARGKRSDITLLRVITQEEKAEQPLLPADFDWHFQTVVWWTKLPEDPLFEECTPADWAYLLDTALIHNALWQGNLSAAGELRLRLANFGATPADRARLRIQVVMAEEAVAKSEARAKPQSSRGRYKAPEAVPEPEADAG